MKINKNKDKVWSSSPLLLQDGGIQKGPLPLLRGRQPGRVCGVPAPWECPLWRTSLHHREVRVLQVGQDSRHQVLQPAVAAVMTPAEPARKSNIIIFTFITGNIIFIIIQRPAESLHWHTQCPLTMCTKQLSLHLTSISTRLLEVVCQVLIGQRWHRQHPATCSLVSSSDPGQLKHIFSSCLLNMKYFSPQFDGGAPRSARLCTDWSIHSLLCEFSKRWLEDKEKATWRRHEHPSTGSDLSGLDVCRRCNVHCRGWI